jgi:hypothetical protein
VLSLRTIESNLLRRKCRPSNKLPSGTASRHDEEYDGGEEEDHSGEAANYHRHLRGLCLAFSNFNLTDLPTQNHLFSVVATSWRRIKGDLRYENPLGGKVKFQLDKPTNPAMKRHRDVARLHKNFIRQGVERHRVGMIDGAAD